MATNQPGIAITIKGFLPTGKTLEEQFTALSIVKTAHETGDYAQLLKAAHDVEVKTEQKTRRIETEPSAPAAAPATVADLADVLPGTQDVADTASKENPIIAALASEPAEDIHTKAKRLGIAWKGRTHDAIAADIEKVEANASAAAEAEDDDHRNA